VEFDVGGGYNLTAPLMYGAGFYQISHLVITEGSYRLPDKSVISDDNLVRWYKTANRGELENLFLTCMRIPAAARTNRSRTKNRTNQLFSASQLQPDGWANAPDFNMAEQGVHFEPTVQLIPDVEATVFEAGNESDAENVPENMDEHVTDVWTTLAIDIMVLSPNKKAKVKTSYTILPVGDRWLVTPEILQTPDLTNLFQGVYVRYVNDGFWGTKLFEMYFPGPRCTMRDGASQNWNKANYFKKWVKLMNMSTAEIIRRAVKKEWMKLRWVPAATETRMWDTKSLASLGSVTPFPDSLTIAAPVIFVRGSEERQPVVVAP
jgi:hypothetical protein